MFIKRMGLWSRLGIRIQRGQLNLGNVGKLVIVFALLLSKDPCVKQTSKPLVTANVLFLRRLGTRIKHLVAGTLKSSGAVM